MTLLSLPLELLQHIVNEPAPKLTPEGRFPKVAEAFVDGCLLKDPDMRQTPKDLLVCTSLPRPALLQHRAVGGAVERGFFSNTFAPCRSFAFSFVSSLAAT